MDTNPPDYFAILKNIFLEIGLKEAEVNELLRDLNIRVEGAVIDAVLAALTPAEAEQLKSKLDQAEKKVEVYTEIIKQACSNSVNKIDLDKLADRARVNAAQLFIKGVKNNLNQSKIDNLNQKIHKLIDSKTETNNYKLVGSGQFV